MFDFLKRKEIDKKMNTHHLDEVIVDAIINPLREFVKYQKEHGYHLPKDFEISPTSWLITLEQILFAFEQKQIEQKGWENKVTKNMTSEQLAENRKIVQKGFELFGKYFQDLYEVDN